MIPTEGGSRVERSENTGSRGKAAEPVMKKERLPKDDGRYIIFYTFDDGIGNEDGEGAEASADGKVSS